MYVFVFDFWCRCWKLSPAAYHGAPDGPDSGAERPRDAALLRWRITAAEYRMVNVLFLARFGHGGRDSFKLVGRLAGVEGGESLVKRIPLPFLPPPPKISFKWSFHPLPLPPSPPLTKKFDQNIPVRNPLEIPEESLKILWPCLKGIFLMKNEKMV